MNREDVPNGGQHLGRRDVRESRFGQLSDRAMVLLRYGDTENRYDGDGSRIVGSIIVDAVNHGCQRDYIRRLLGDPQHKGGFASLRRRRNVDRWFTGEWTRAMAKVTDSPVLGDRHEATMRAVELAQAAEGMQWKGTGGATDHAVWRHVLGVAARAGRLAPLALAVRDVAESVGIERSTAGRSLHRLANEDCSGASLPAGEPTLRSTGCDTTAPQWTEQPETPRRRRRPTVGDAATPLLPTPVIPVWDPYGAPVSHRPTPGDGRDWATPPSGCTACLVSRP